ncbi:Hypothetical protein GLP15_273 [Giardia lamblia P15]|uniref:Uncharacterized protein n=1 Tax=Giardia intestinalis (strain P15) TaxID=658858 RepID=E1F5W4_GIAIA|nr:Hypothetical protein GLP15_273 [Giardia lamblia P15]
MRSSIAAVTAGITSSLLRDSISGTHLTIAGIAPGELQPKKTYLYNSIKSVAINRGICSNIFSEPDCTTVSGVMQYPLRAATKLVLSDILDQCVDLAFTGSLGDPVHARKSSMQPSRTPSIADKAIRSRSKLEKLDRPSMTTPEYWKRFMSDVLVSTASDLVYDIGRKRAAMINSGSNPSVMDTATWAFASAAAGEFVRAKLDNKYTPDYVRAGVRSAIFKTSFAYVYALLLASPSAEKF